MDSDKITNEDSIEEGEYKDCESDSSPMEKMKNDFSNITIESSDISKNEDISIEDNNEENAANNVNAGSDGLKNSTNLLDDNTVNNQTFPKVSEKKIDIIINDASNHKSTITDVDSNKDHDISTKDDSEYIEEESKIKSLEAINEIQNLDFSSEHSSSIPDLSELSSDAHDKSIEKKKSNEDSLTSIPDLEDISKDTTSNAVDQIVSQSNQLESNLTTNEPEPLNKSETKQVEKLITEIPSEQVDKKTENYLGDYVVVDLEECSPNYKADQINEEFTTVQSDSSNYQDETHNDKPDNLLETSASNDNKQGGDNLSVDKEKDIQYVKNEHITRQQDLVDISVQQPLSYQASGDVPAKVNYSEPVFSTEEIKNTHTNNESTTYSSYIEESSSIESIILTEDRVKVNEKLIEGESTPIKSETLINQTESINLLETDASNKKEDISDENLNIAENEPVAVVTPSLVIETQKDDIVSSDMPEESSLIVDFFENGLLVKKITRLGDDKSDKPKMGDLVNIAFTCILTDNGKILEEDEIFVVLGEGDIAMGADMCIQSMVEEEEADVAIHPRYGYRDYPWTFTLGSIPPHSHLTYHIKLLNFASFPDATTENYSKIYEICTKKKNRGNLFYKINDYVDAAHCYTNCNKHISNLLGYEAFKIDVRNNISACHMKLKDYLSAKEMLSLVLQADPNNLKALMRMSTSLEELGDLQPAWEYSKRAIQIKPDQLTIFNQFKRLTDKCNTHKENFSQMAKKMFIKPTSSKEEDTIKQEKLKPIEQSAYPPWLKMGSLSIAVLVLVAGSYLFFKK